MSSKSDPSKVTYHEKVNYQDGGHEVTKTTHYSDGREPKTEVSVYYKPKKQYVPPVIDTSALKHRNSTLYTVFDILIAIILSAFCFHLIAFYHTGYYISPTKVIENLETLDYGNSPLAWLSRFIMKIQDAEGFSGFLDVLKALFIEPFIMMYNFFVDLFNLLAINRIAVPLNSYKQVFTW